MCINLLRLFFCYSLAIRTILLVLLQPCKAEQHAAPVPQLEKIELLMTEALQHLDDGDADAALLDFKQVIAQDHQYLPALLGAAMVYADQEQHALAFEFYDQVLVQQPQHAMAWNGRGLAAFNLERMDEAIVSFERSVADQPVNGFLYEALAWAQMCARDAASAIQSAKESLLMYSQTDADSIYPTLIIYFCSLELNDLKNAQRALRYAVKNHQPKQWPAPVIYYLNDSIDSRELLSCVVNSAEETEAHVYIGLRLMHENEPEQAHRHLQWAAEHGDPAVFEYSLARSLVKFSASILTTQIQTR
jgi:tetratricopeptide (TPR) repeat protein